jgi:phosphoribosylanthranilate isomerase
MPSGPGVITEDQIAQIAAQMPPGVASFLLTSQQNSESIINQQRCCGVNTLQLVDKLSIQDYSRLREALPGIALVQVLHVTDERAIEEARTVAPYVNGLLLDSGNPSLPVKELGGTGRVHNWKISRVIRETVNVPVFLAGGINPDNVAQAIQQVAPFGIDVCSGVRSHGQLDEVKLSAFFASIQEATTPEHFR